MGDRAVSDDNNQRLANELGTSTAFLLHERTGFIRSEARTDSEPRRDLGGVLSKNDGGCPVTPPYPITQDIDGSGVSASARRRVRNRQRAIAQPDDDDYAATGIGRNVRHDVRWVDMDLESRSAGEVTIRYEYYSALLRLGVFRGGRSAS